MAYQFKIALSFATEEQSLVEAVYHYLCAENVNAFFAPSTEGQVVLSGMNQREIFYRIFGLESEYVALFVSKHYVSREVSMEEARIALAKHSGKGSVIPIYLDNTPLPAELFNPKDTNYFKSNNPAVIANHLVSKMKLKDANWSGSDSYKDTGKMVIRENTAQKQIFVNTLNGSITL